MTGKEALIALANGEDVEWRHPEREWFKAPKTNMNTCHFFSGIYEFRLKPRTITINGIEVPTPFEPKEGESFWYMHSHSKCGYSHSNHLGIAYFGAWRTEEEIKQVVAALRSIFK